ncbi:MAG: hypothetical protein EXQ70_04790 [Solirubrobacterales bacterium]|nr:hypothetical protein [Solirubrobacterales bacterium]
MRDKLRRPSPAMVVAVIALIAAIGGTAYAGVKIGKNAVKSNQIAANAVTNSELKNIKVNPLVKVTAAASQAAASQNVLAQRGALTVYGKCFVEGPVVRAVVYLKSSEAGAVLDSDADNQSGNGTEPIDGYVNPGEAESDNEIENSASAAVNDADDGDDEHFWAARDNTAISGSVLSFAKQGSPVAGDGPYGAGNRCLFQAHVLGVG